MSFDTTISSFLEMSDKTIDKISSFIVSKENKNISKESIKRGGNNLGMLFRDNKLNKKVKKNIR